MVPEIIGAIVVTALSLLGFLVRQWVESIRQDLHEHMLVEEKLRQQDCSTMNDFRREVREEMSEIRNDIRKLHERIDRVLFNGRA
ncbi:MAG: hypothetical protein NZL87_05400, partial [Thermomicrobium sp.]|nr:hypothetical protein [Thermomicrobium sp.]